MGELGTVRRYSYWSDRRIRSIAADNDIELDRRQRLTFRSPAFGLLPQTEFTKERKGVQRHEVAQRIERAIGQLAIEDFVTPPPTAFAKGCGEVTLAAYTQYYPEKSSERTGIIAHTRTVSSDGCRVEICLFGSLDNCADYLSTDGVETSMWSSSSAWSIEEFIANRGTRPAPIYDDDESIAVEILRVFNNEGLSKKRVFERLTNAEWFAGVYKDVKLDKKRWDHRLGVDLPEPVDRIVIGQPLWIRSSHGAP